MFGIGMPELVVVLVVALVVLGPKRLPELARQLGRAMAEFRRQTSDVIEEFDAELRAEEDATRRQRAAAATATAAAASPGAAAGPAPEGAPATEPRTTGSR
jgi:Tat protein translocase TatB subunit